MPRWPPRGEFAAIRTPTPWKWRGRCIVNKGGSPTTITTIIIVAGEEGEEEEITTITTAVVTITEEEDVVDGEGSAKIGCDWLASFSTRLHRQLITKPYQGKPF
ncbi:hypothetical protein ACHAXS_004905 [Conticribra weissflogii]